MKAYGYVCLVDWRALGGGETVVGVEADVVDETSSKDKKFEMKMDDAAVIRGLVSSR